MMIWTNCHFKSCFINVDIMQLHTTTITHDYDKVYFSPAVFVWHTPAGWQEHLFFVRGGRDISITVAYDTFQRNKTKRIVRAQGCCTLHIMQTKTILIGFAQNSKAKKAYLEEMFIHGEI